MPTNSTLTDTWRIATRLHTVANILQQQPLTPSLLRRLRDRVDHLALDMRRVVDEYDRTGEVP